MQTDSNLVLSTLLLLAGLRRKKPDGKQLGSGGHLTNTLPVCRMTAFIYKTRYFIILFEMMLLPLRELFYRRLNAHSSEVRGE